MNVSTEGGRFPDGEVRGGGLSASVGSGKAGVGMAADFKKDFNIHFVSGFAGV